jgi:hypothetical protein
VGWISQRSLKIRLRLLLPRVDHFLVFMQTPLPSGLDDIPREQFPRVDSGSFLRCSRRQEASTGKPRIAALRLHGPRLLRSADLGSDVLIESGDPAILAPILCAAFESDPEKNILIQSLYSTL